MNEEEKDKEKEERDKAEERRCSAQGVMRIKSEMGSAGAAMVERSVLAGPPAMELWDDLLGGLAGDMVVSGEREGGLDNGSDAASTVTTSSNALPLPLSDDRVTGSMATLAGRAYVLQNSGPAVAKNEDTGADRGQASVHDCSDAVGEIHAATPSSSSSSSPRNGAWGSSSRSHLPALARAGDFSEDDVLVAVAFSESETEEEEEDGLLAVPLESEEEEEEEEPEEEDEDDDDDGGILGSPSGGSSPRDSFSGSGSPSVTQISGRASARPMATE